MDEKTIARNLRELRKRRGLSQVRLAEKVGIQKVLVSQHELGKVRIHGALLAAFAKALRTSADEILGLKESKKTGTSRTVASCAAWSRSTGFRAGRKTRC